jgi:RNA polymerase sigma-70 factor (ECF subfamily)
MRYQDRIYRLATGMLRAPHAAADATQEVFLRAYTGLPRFRFGASVYTWLFATLRNVCRELNRRERPVVDGPPKDIEDCRYEPARRAGAEERLERVMRRVRDLPQRQRDVFLLRIFEGLSVAETAKVLRCREGTVKVHLHRAMNAIRDVDHTT